MAQQLQGAKGCLSYNVANESSAPSPPPHQQKWRKSGYSEPGTRVIHPALVQDFPKGHEQGVVFGSTATHRSSDLHVHDLLNNQEGECANAKREQNEKMYYKSSARAPVGKTCSRGHKLPESMTQAPDYRFGITTAKNTENVKSLLQSAASTTEGHAIEGKGGAKSETAAESNYVKSHRSYKPGEQRRRNYDWPIDPATTTFGNKGERTAERGSSKGVHDALHMVEDAGSAPHPKGKNSPATLDATEKMLFVRKEKKGDSSSVAECLKYSTSERDNDDQDNLGKSKKPGFRNATTENRCFGCPTVRVDVPKHSRRSVADTQNYGDDVNAGKLLRPSQFALIGIADDEFSKPRSRNEIRDLFSSSCCDNKIDEGTFNRLFGSIADKNGMGTVERFQKVHNDFLFASQDAHVLLCGKRN